MINLMTSNFMNLSLPIHHLISLPNFSNSHLEFVNKHFYRQGVFFSKLGNSAQHLKLAMTPGKKSEIIFLVLALSDRFLGYVYNSRHPKGHVTLISHERSQSSGEDLQPAEEASQICLHLCGKKVKCCHRRMWTLATAQFDPFSKKFEWWYVCLLSLCKICSQKTKTKFGFSLHCHENFLKIVVTGNKLWLWSLDNSQSFLWKPLAFWNRGRHQQVEAMSLRRAQLVNKEHHPWLVAPMSDIQDCLCCIQFRPKSMSTICELYGPMALCIERGRPGLNWEAVANRVSTVFMNWVVSQGYT